MDSPFIRWGDAMKIRFAHILFVSIGLALCASSDTLIDDFSTAQGPVIDESTVSGSGILGGSRYIHYAGNESNYVESTAGNLDFTYGDISSGDYITINYDGGAGTIEPNYTGLGGLNLGGADGFLRFSINASTDIDLYITAWTDEDYASDISGVTVTDSGAPFIFDVYFSNFDQYGPVGSADFSNIGALQIAIYPTGDEHSNATMSINEIQAVPEPASAALMLGATIAGLLIRRLFCD